MSDLYLRQTSESFSEHVLRALEVYTQYHDINKILTN